MTWLKFQQTSIKQSLLRKEELQTVQTKEEANVSPLKIQAYDF